MPNRCHTDFNALPSSSVRSFGGSGSCTTRGGTDSTPCFESSWVNPQPSSCAVLKHFWHSLFCQSSQAWSCFSCMQVLHRTVLSSAVCHFFHSGAVKSILFSRCSSTNRRKSSNCVAIWGGIVNDGRAAIALRCNCVAICVQMT